MCLALLAVVAVQLPATRALEESVYAAEEANLEGAHEH